MIKRKIIVTDLTRFSEKNPDIVCIAGIDINTGQCIRPIPYLKTEECQQLNIFPGTILSGEFLPDSERIGPHQEDMKYQNNLQVVDICHANEFKSMLEHNLQNSLEQGFDIQLPYKQRFLPIDYPITKSIITLKVHSHDIDIIKNDYRPGGKLNFLDNSGREYRFFPITDLGFHQLINEHLKVNNLNSLNAFMRSQSEVYLRIGLGRPWKKPDTIEEGYWMQINGIYTFPNYHQEIRSYR